MNREALCHAGFVYVDGERWDFDGVAIAVADRYRIDMVQGLLAGLAAAGVAPRAATAADPRRVARAAVQLTFPGSPPRRVGIFERVA